MGSRSFTDKAAKAEVAEAIRAIEAATSAEVVVAVRARSGLYRHTDYIVGFVFAFAALLISFPGDTLRTALRSVMTLGRRQPAPLEMLVPAFMSYARTARRQS